MTPPQTLQQAGPGPIGWGLIAIVALAPIPLGAARPWSAALLAALLALLTTAWAVTQFRYASSLPIGLHRLRLPACLFGAAVVWAFWQTLPIVPEAWIHPMWREAEAVLGPLEGTVSLTPLAGRDAVMQLLAYATVFFLSLQYGRHAAFAWRMIGAIAVSSALYAAYGLFNVVSGMEMIGWLDKWAYRGMATGTLVNANHFATLTGFGLLCCLALLARRDDAPDALRRGRPIWLVCAIILLVVLPFSHSRAGMFSTGCGALFLLSLIAKRRESQRLAIGILAVLAVGAIGMLMADSAGSIIWVDSADHRFHVFHLTGILIAQRPLLGTGLGSFMDAFAAIREVGMVPNWNAAHNTYLELMLELGLPAALLLLAAEAWLVWRCAYGAIYRRRQWLVCVLGLAVSLQLALHSMIDFSAQIPAVAVCWAALLGVGVAQSWSSQTRGSATRADETAEA